MRCRLNSNKTSSGKLEKGHTTDTEHLKPEAAYFFATDRERGAFFVVASRRAFLIDYRANVPTCSGHAILKSHRFLGFSTGEKVDAPRLSGRCLLAQPDQKSLSSARVAQLRGENGH